MKCISIIKKSNILRYRESIYIQSTDPRRAFSKRYAAFTLIILIYFGTIAFHRIDRYMPDIKIKTVLPIPYFRYLDKVPTPYTWNLEV